MLLRRLIICSFGVALIASADDKPPRDLFSMELDELLSLEVTTSRKMSDKLYESTASISVITADDIRLFGWRNLPDILNSLAGFNVYSDRVYDFVVARGAAQRNDPNSRILLLLNGHSMIENFGYFNGQLATVDVSHIDRIEVVRGPGSAIYGTNAMYAVINVITKNQTTQVGVDFGSFNDQKIQGSGYWNWDDWQFNGSFSYSTGEEEDLFFDEYTDPIYNTGGYTSGAANREQLTNGLLTAQYGDLKFQVYHNQRRKYVPTGIYGGRIDQSDTFFQDTNQHFDASYRYAFNQYLTVRTRLYYDRYQFDGRYLFLQDPNEQSGPNYPSEYNRVKSSYQGFEILIENEWGPHTRTIYGIEYRKYNSFDFVVFSENDPLVQLNIHDNINPDEVVRSGFFTHEVRFLPEFKLDFGLHFDDYKSVGRYYSIRAASSYDLLEHGLIKFQFSEAFRAPNSWELNGGFFLNGNSFLKAETIQKYELGYQYSLSSKWLISSSLFKYDTDMTIRTDQFNSFTNVEGISGKGLELEVNYWSSDWRVFSSLSLAKAKTNDGQVRTFYAPEEQVKLGVARRLIDDLHFSAELLYMGDRKTPYTVQPYLPSVTILNTKLGDWYWGDWRVSMSVRNLLNKDYQHPSFPADLTSNYLNQNFPVYDIPAEGRHLYLSFIWEP